MATTEKSSDIEKRASDSHSEVNVEQEVDLSTFHEQNAGRLVVDPHEAEVEFGPAIAARLKLSRDGTKVLWPQPTDSPNDPQNWSDGRKSLHLFIMTLAAILPDFQSAIGIPSLFGLATTFGTTVDEINNLTSNWSIFLLGWGGLAAVMLINRLGRLPVLFWSQVLSQAFLLGCVFAPNLSTFAAFRCITAFFATCPQIAGLYTVTDLYPFHMQARMINVWTMGFIVSPFVSPFLLGFVAARTTWRWAYGIGNIYGLGVIILILLFMDETIYDRTVKPVPEANVSGLRGRIETLVGITGWRMQKYRISWFRSFIAPLNVVWRPHLFFVLFFEAFAFGFGIGMNVTNVVFLGEPGPVGFGWSAISIAGAYVTPIVAVFIGELIGRYLNDWIMNTSIRRNNGVFEAETRLWATYLGVPLFVIGFVSLGVGIQHKNTGAVIMGWGITETSIMIITVAIYAYGNDSFPRHQGEISALVNLARTLGGFAIPYFQVPWVTKSGAIQTFGCEAAIVAGLWVLIIPAIQIFGRPLRKKFSIHHAH